MITLRKILHRFRQPLRSFFQSFTFWIFTNQLKNFTIIFYKSTCDLVFELFYFFICHKTNLKIFFVLSAKELLLSFRCTVYPEQSEGHSCTFSSLLNLILNLKLRFI